MTEIDKLVGHVGRNAVIASVDLTSAAKAEEIGALPYRSTESAAPPKIECRIDLPYSAIGAITDGESAHAIPPPTG
jgi:hypothetical protein